MTVGVRPAPVNARTCYWKRTPPIARKLRADAGSYGFAVITEEAKHVQALVALVVPPARLRPALYDLIHLCLAARPATCAEDDPLLDVAEDSPPL
ncbi:MAG: hypothetical protein KAY37_07955 [Phycisphaerae bacterium]|nr:hypothetical protein [Phycisphaerae bacterium]